MKFKTIIPPAFLIILISIAVLIAACWNFLTGKNINPYLLLVADALLFIIFSLVFIMQRKALSNPNPNAFIRSVMGGMMIKMFFCIIAIMAYVLIARNAVNKISLFIALFFYFIYLAVEVSILMKLNKQKNA
jgi:heme/copper-type cytochrome/quinol oxidase subunit 3